MQAGYSHTGLINMECVCVCVQGSDMVYVCLVVTQGSDCATMQVGSECLRRRKSEYIKNQALRLNTPLPPPRLNFCATKKKWL